MVEYWIVISNVKGSNPFIRLKNKLYFNKYIINLTLKKFTMFWNKFNFINRWFHTPFKIRYLKQYFDLHFIEPWKGPSSFKRFTRPIRRLFFKYEMNVTPYLEIFAMSLFLFILFYIVFNIIHYLLFIFIMDPLSDEFVYNYSGLDSNIGWFFFFDHNIDLNNYDDQVYNLKTLIYNIQFLNFDVVITLIRSFFLFLIISFLYFMMNNRIKYMHILYYVILINIIIILFDCLNINNFFYYNFFNYFFDILKDYVTWNVKYSVVNITWDSFLTFPNYDNNDYIDFNDSIEVIQKYYIPNTSVKDLPKLHFILKEIYKLTILNDFFFTLSTFFKVNMISFLLILLSVLIIFLCYIYLYNNDNFYMKSLPEWSVYLSLLLFALIGAFSVNDILGFFIFFELTLIPIYLLVIRFGSKERKIRAAYLIVLYTFFGSVFLFISIMIIYSQIGSTNYDDLLSINFSINTQLILWFLFFMAFSVKIPTFPFHIWLPEAHVEAPTIGSVILAALLLKLGLYGIIKFNILLLNDVTDIVRNIVYFLTLLSIFVSGFVSIRQTDIKKIIAYSSIGHMNLVFLGLYTFSQETLEGCIFQMFNHGLISGGLFFCVGFLYDRYYTRLFSFYGGLVIICPLTAFFFFLFILSNISFPLTNSFIAEFLIYAGMFSKSDIIVYLSGLNMVLVAIYSMKLYSQIFFGNFNTRLLKVEDLSYKEFLILFSLMSGILFTGICSDVFMQLLHFDTLYILEKIRIS